MLPRGSWPVDRGDHDCAVLVGPAVRRVAVPERTSVGRREARMIKAFEEIPRDADRVIFFPRAAGGA